MYKYILAALLTVIITGCSFCEPTPQDPVIIYKTVYKTKIVKTPVVCDIATPTCDFKGKGYQPAIKAMECVTKQKRYIEACKGKVATTE